jgi:predicted translin family RNA/ssDNA-binding protein
MAIILAESIISLARDKIARDARELEGYLRAGKYNLCYGKIEEIHRATKAIDENLAEIRRYATSHDEDFYDDMEEPTDEIKRGLRDRFGG